MANALPLTPPSLVGIPGNLTITPNGSAFPDPYASFRRMDILQVATTGSVVNINPTGLLATIAGPSTSAITIGTTAVAGTPAQTLYGVVTYVDAGGGESQPSSEFVLNTPAGFKATVTVSATGEPSNTSHFRLYGGTLPGTEIQQVASTSTGSPATMPYPLTNHTGLIQAPSNASSAIVGLAEADFDVTYAPLQAVPGSGYSNRQLFGINAVIPPLGYYEQYQTKYYPLVTGMPFEICLLQAWYPSLVGTTAGILYSSTYQCHAADTSQSNKLLTIVGKVQGPDNPTYSSVGDVGDTGARVLVQFNSGLFA